DRKEHFQALVRAARQRQKDRQGPAFVISERVSAGMRHSLRSKKGGHHWETLVDYSLQDLMGHLERQSLKGMSWENMGKWHIDHITPLAAFRYESCECDGFRQAWCLSNLRPLWAKENMRKSDSRTHLI